MLKATKQWGFSNCSSLAKQRITIISIESYMFEDIEGRT